MRHYIALTKPSITWLILMSTGLGYFFGLPGRGWGDWLSHAATWRALHTLLGTGLMASGTAALNEWYERDIDRKMRRTAARPIPSGAIRPSSALTFGISISAAGFADLAVFVNWYSALLGLLTLTVYLLVYTPLKTRSWICTAVGAFPGALPPVIGFTAAHDSLNSQGLLLGLILFVWQFPHFYSIAWMYREDYGRAGISMLPVTEPDCVSTARQILLAAVLLIPISIVPVLFHMVGHLYGLAALLVGCRLLHSSIRLYVERTGKAARAVLLVSILYLPLLYACMAVDRVWVS